MAIDASESQQNSAPEQKTNRATLIIKGIGYILFGVAVITLYFLLSHVEKIPGVTKLEASNAAAEDCFGSSVAIEGETIIVGAVHKDDRDAKDAGAVYVYKLNDSSWSATKLIASDVGYWGHFGSSVAIEGETIIVGAERKNASGAVYIYKWDGSSWSETKLIASDAEDWDSFGSSVAIEDNTIAIGAYCKDERGAENAGVVYIYKWDGSKWNETKLTASDAAAEDFFGWSVAIDGDTIAVGAMRKENSGMESSGAVYVYKWNGSSWNEIKLTASDAAAEDCFGSSVAIEGDAIIVGAFCKDEHGAKYAGAVYIYNWDDSKWNETKLTASDAAAEDFFGSSVAIGGDAIIVGAERKNASGAVYIYKWDGSSWSETKLTAFDADEGDCFGSSVSFSGNRLVVGAFGKNNGLFRKKVGAAYVYNLDKIK